MESFPNLNNYDYIHFIGIGGVSMSSLALILKDKGKIVTGSDSTESNNTKILIKNGIDVIIGHNASNIKKCDLVVYTAAISDDNPELVYAKENDIPIIERATLLGSLMLTYKNSIAVSGTHGKTTTTSMISSILLDANVDPTILVGAHFNQINSNYKTGHSDYAVYEACEYVNSFHHFYPAVAVILNIDADHLDFFKNIENIRSSFLKFTNNVNNDGLVVLNGDDINCNIIKKEINKNIITFGFDNSNDCYAKNIKYNNGKPTYDVYYKNKLIKEIELSVIGKHNIINSLSAICVAKHFGIDENNIKSGLLKFKGADRRFEVKKYINGAAIVDDYAHHPTEIHATLAGAKEVGYNNIYVIFQSHTFTRTKVLLDDFAKELSIADYVILTDIYSAREINTIGANIIELKNKIPNSKYISSFDDIAHFIKNNAQKGDLFILMGAGNINNVIDLL